MTGGEREREMGRGWEMTSGQDQTWVHRFMDPLANCAS